MGKEVFILIRNKRTWLINLRKSRNMTQQDLANAVNLDITTIGKYELGERQPSPKIAKMIAAVLGFDWTRFFDEENAEKCGICGGITFQQSGTCKYCIACGTSNGCS
jgi:DNA-binding XRE family transcriptional regulator